MPEGAPARRSPPSQGALLAGLTVVATVLVLAGTPGASGGGATAAPTCGPDDGPVVLEGQVLAADAETYLLLPFEVQDGTTRVEVGYEWADVRPAETEDVGPETVLDLGLWDEDGTDGIQAFRGWSGSRQGLVAEGQDPVFVQADDAERGYVVGEVEPGTWHVELGLGFVASGGATYEVTVRCLDAEVGEPPAPDPVDPDHVARDEPGWYVGDLHLHAYHSNPEGLAGQEMVAAAVEAGLDFIPVTEYVTPAHWTELGQVQEDNPDVVIWPGREVITYAGHAVVLGETPSTVEHRVGYEGASLGAVQEASREDGALFSVAHPTTFPGEAGEELCRGCEFTLGDDIDWSAVDTIEVVTQGALLDASFEPDPVGGTVENPFVATAVDLWEEQLLAGNRITAVGGSDDKEGDQYGSAATAVWAEQLSRDALADALQAGHAYVLARGTEHSPEVEVTASAGGQEAIVGDTLVVDAEGSAEVEVVVAGGDGSFVEVSRNGEPVEVVPIVGDDFTYTFTADRVADEEGPLGSFWRVDTFDDASATTIGNPIFLADELPEPVQRPAGGITAAADQSTALDDEAALVEDGIAWSSVAILVGGASPLVGFGVWAVRAQRRGA